MTDYSQRYDVQFKMICEAMPEVAKLPADTKAIHDLYAKLEAIDSKIHTANGMSYEFLHYSRALNTLKLYSLLQDKEDQEQLVDEMLSMDQTEVLIKACHDYDRMLVEDIKAYCAMMPVGMQKPEAYSDQIITKLKSKYTMEKDDDKMLSVLAGASTKEKVELAETVPLWLATHSAICLYKIKDVRRTFFKNTYDPNFLASEKKLSPFGVIEKGFECLTNN
jgi:hypothetical protein